MLPLLSLVRVAGVRGGFLLFFRVLLLVKRGVCPKEAASLHALASALLSPFVSACRSCLCGVVCHGARTFVCAHARAWRSRWACFGDISFFCRRSRRRSRYRDLVCLTSLAFWPQNAWLLLPHDVPKGLPQSRAQHEEDGRRTRQRLHDFEVRLDEFDSRLQQHDLRLNFVEAHIKVVLRGFDAVPEFFRAKDNDFRLAKAAFIAAFVAEMKENTGAEANASLAEAEGLICDRPNFWLRPFRSSPTGFGNPRGKAKARVQDTVRAIRRSLGGRARRGTAKAKRLARCPRWLPARPD